MSLVYVIQYISIQTCHDRSLDYSRESKPSCEHLANIFLPHDDIIPTLQQTNVLKNCLIAFYLYNYL